jgi:hypothetical protein
MKFTACLSGRPEYHDGLANFLSMTCILNELTSFVSSRIPFRVHHGCRLALLNVVFLIFHPPLRIRPIRIYIKNPVSGYCPSTADVALPVDVMVILPQRLGLPDIDDPRDGRSSHSKPIFSNSRIREGVIVDCCPACKNLYWRPVSRKNRAGKIN